jgi:type I restriction enzyme M protein
LGELINRRTRVLRPEDIRKIADTYHEWQKGKDGNYQDIAGFCKSASLEEVRNLDYVLTPGRYVGLPDEEDDFDFEERFTRLKAEFMDQLKEEEILNKRILENLAKIDLSKPEDDNE